MDKLHFHDFFPSLLTEGHCVMVDLPEHKAIMEFINKIPAECVYEEEGQHYGKEKRPHITVMYGLEPIAEDKAKQMLSKMPKRISATLGKISKFENADTPYDVLKIEVHSPHLTKIHETLKRTCENNYKWPNYNPHVTLAYVKKGTCNEFVGSKVFEGQKFVFETFTYSNGVRQENHPIEMKEYAIGQGGGYGGAAGGAVAAGNWAGTPIVPQTSRRMNLDSASRRTTYMQGNTVIGSSLHDTITGDDLTHPQFSPEEIFSGLRHEMKKMEYPDKNIAREEVIKNLQKNPKYYSDLGMYFDNPKQGPQS